MKKKSKNRLQINIKHNHNKIMENIQRVRIRQMLDQKVKIRNHISYFHEIKMDKVIDKEINDYVKREHYDKHNVKLKPEKVYAKYVWISRWW